MKRTNSLDNSIKALPLILLYIHLFHYSEADSEYRLVYLDPSYIQQLLSSSLPGKSICFLYLRKKGRTIPFFSRLTIDISIKVISSSVNWSFVGVYFNQAKR